MPIDSRCRIRALGKRVDVFGLIVGPNSRVVTFAARSMHVAAAGLDNAFGSPDLGKAEFRVDYRIRGLQDQFVRDCRHELPTRAEFGSDICGRKCLSDSTSPEEGIHHGRISGLQYADSGIEQFGPNDVAARNASFRRVVTICENSGMEISSVCEPMLRIRYRSQRAGCVGEGKIVRSMAKTGAGCSTSSYPAPRH